MGDEKSDNDFSLLFQGVAAVLPNQRHAVDGEKLAGFS
jgi:hypothetical protein